MSGELGGGGSEMMRIEGREGDGCTERPHPSWEIMLMFAMGMWRAGHPSPRKAADVSLSVSEPHAEAREPSSSGGREGPAEDGAPADGGAKGAARSPGPAR